MITNLFNQNVSEITRRPPLFLYKGTYYWEIQPIADSEELLEFKRLILYHKREGTSLIWVEGKNVYAGWVVGIAKP